MTKYIETLTEEQKEKVDGYDYKHLDSSTMDLMYKNMSKDPYKDGKPWDNSCYEYFMFSTIEDNIKDIISKKYNEQGKLEVVDLGSGNTFSTKGIKGWFDYYHMDNVTYKGVDISQTAIDWCKERTEFKEFLQADLENITPEIGAYWSNADVIFLVEVIYYCKIKNRKQVLKDIVKYMKPGAILVVTLAHMKEVFQALVGEPEVETIAEYFKDKKRVHFVSRYNDGKPYMDSLPFEGSIYKKK